MEISLTVQNPPFNIHDQTLNNIFFSFPTKGFLFYDISFEDIDEVQQIAKCFMSRTLFVVM